MREQFLAHLARYGEPFEYEGATHRGFIQALRRTQEHGYGSYADPLGEMSLEEFVYYGDAALALSEGARLRWSGKTLRVTQAKTVRAAGEAVYLWATLKEAVA